MALEVSNLFQAMGSIGATGTVVWNKGALAACSGAGTYTLTLIAGQGIDATECACFVTGRGTAKTVFYVAQTSDTVKTVNAFDNANAALNSAFDWMICRAPGG